MNRYERYKDSGIPWLGEVPENWIIMPIKFSLAMPITDGPHETPEILSDGIPFISAEAVKNDKLDFNKKRGYISEEDNARFSKKYSPQKGDIYMVKSGATTGNVAKVETDEVFNIWSPLAVMRPNKNKISTDFLFYAIKSDYFNTSVQLKWNMGTQQNIGMGILSNIRVVIPPTDEQTAIAHYLDTKLNEIDALIDKQQTLLEKLAEQRTALITHAVTKGLNPAAPMKNSGVEWLGDVPVHWEVLSIKRLSQVKRGASPRPIDNPDYFDDDGEYAWVRIADVTASNMYLLETTQRLSDLGKSFSVPLQPNSLFLSIAGSVGKPIITKIKACIHDGFVYFPEYKNNIKFLYYIFCSGQPYLGLGKMGTQLNLNTDTVGAIKIALPPKEEQANIAEYLDQETAKIDRLCDTVNQTIVRLKEYRTALITQAVTGKIKVTDE